MANTIDTSHTSTEKGSSISLTNAPIEQANSDEKGTSNPQQVEPEINEKSIPSPTSPQEVPSKENGANTDPTAEPPIERTVSAGVDYSILSVRSKRMVVMTASLASIFSPMATAIYYPSLNTIATDLGVTNTKINITVTLFLVIQGIAPSFVADLADRSGRRPMYIFCYIVFSGANIGLALQNKYAALLVLRMLQAAGSSGTVALANGVVGDIVTSAERGAYIAFASLGGILAPMIAPIIGGAIGQYAGWHFIFWFLLIFSSAVFVPLILFMPETCRGVVDNGSIPPPYLSTNFTDIIRHKRRTKAGIVVDYEKRDALHKKNELRIPNPFSTLKVLSDLESAVILIATGLGLGCFYAVSTGMSDAFTKIYGYDQIKISLLFIPIGGGSICSAFTSAKLVDWNFRRHAAILGVPVIKNRRQDLSNFPIEKARLQIAFPMFFLAGTFLVVFGWLVEKHVMVAGPIVALFFAGYGLTCTFQILNVLMVDIYPGKPSIATAANNLIRCEIGAVFSAIVLPIADAIGFGWTYTLLSLIFMSFAPVLLIIMKKGPRWRRERKEKEDKAKAARDEKKHEKELKNAAK